MLDLRVIPADQAAAVPAPDAGRAVLYLSDVAGRLHLCARVHGGAARVVGFDPMPVEPDPEPEPEEPAPPPMAGAVWVERSEKHVPRLIMSADGSVLLGSEYWGALSISMDFGDTWQDVAGVPYPEPWYGLAASDNGKTLMAVTENGDIHLSRDGGDAWGVVHGGAAKKWRACAMSADGSVLYAYDGEAKQCAISHDAGDTWLTIDRGGGDDYEIVAMSGDGQTIIAGRFVDELRISRDAGINWQPLGVVYGEARSALIALSGDGSKVVVIANGLVPRISSDGGATWATANEPGLDEPSWQHVAVSRDGARIAIVGESVVEGVIIGSTYTSDGGAPFDLAYASANGRWKSFAMSGDGAFMAAMNPETAVVLTSYGDAP